MSTISLLPAGSPYTQNFDTLASTGSSDAVPLGWTFTEAGSSGNNNGLYAAGTGSSNAGDTYSFGPAGSSDRAFGGLLSGTLTPTLGAAIRNDTGSTISALNLSFTGEQWRLGTANRGSDRLDFQYSVDATSLTSGTWVDFNALDFSSPITAGPLGALDGNAAANRTSISSLLTGITLAPGATLWIRWTDFNVTGADDGLAIDDFAIAYTTQQAALPVVSVTAGDANAAEQGSDPGSFVFSRTGPTTEALTISYSVGGTATAADYTPALSGSVVIPAGSASVTVQIAPVDDALVEAAETVVVSVQAGTGYTAASGTATVTIEDNDTGLTLISSIQGSGNTSPLTGQTVTIQAIVVGDFQGSAGISGFFVQEETADQDANPATSEGLFIFQGASYTTEVAVGDLIRVTGRVAEFTSGTSSLTQLTSITGLQVLSSSQTLPAATSISFPLPAGTSLEPLEGMRVAVTTTMTVTDVFSLGRFGEVLLSSDGPGNQPGTDARLDTFTQFNLPSVAGYNNYLADIAARRLLLDDANGSQNRDPIRYGRDGDPLSATNTLRGGDTVSGLEGILDDRFGNANTGQYRLQPTADVDFQATNPRPDTPGIEGRIKVASFNVLNFFNGPTFPTSRGADSQAEYDRQLAKIVSAINGLQADVIGLIEIENDGYGPTGALATLVNALNAAAGAGTYAYVNPGRPALGGDEIAVAFIYRTATVETSGNAAVLDSSVDARFNTDQQRPSLAQTFRDKATDALFTPVVSHLKSKGSSAGGPGDSDAGDGQGQSNGTRTQAALALADWIATDPTGSGDPDFILLGDFNAYAMEDPIRALLRGSDDAAGTADDLVDLIGVSQYSYTFSGQWGSLDHALGSASLQSQVVDAGPWNINADEPPVLDYNVEFKTPNQQTVLYAPGPFRSADHDPLVVGLNPGRTIQGTSRTDTLTGTIGNDTLVGAQGRDLLLGGAGADRFEFRSLLDLYDAIGDFQPGVDRLDIRALMAAVGAPTADPVAGGYLGTVALQPVKISQSLAVGLAYTLVTFDPDGSAGPAAPRPLVELIGVAVDDPAVLLGA